jgi:hypothetical protein
MPSNNYRPQAACPDARKHLRSEAGCMPFIYRRSLSNQQQHTTVLLGITTSQVPRSIAARCVQAAERQSERSAGWPYKMLRQAT